MKKQVRCDLALEAKEMFSEGQPEDSEIPGVSVECEEIQGYIKVTRVHIRNGEGAQNLQKEQGRYITIEMPARFYGQQTIYEEMCRTCSKELRAITTPLLKEENDTVLVVGLGNWNITADALGPKVIRSLMVTRHLKEYVPEEIDEGIRPVCAIAPGVLGITGIETGEIVRGLVEKIKPKLVIAIDALCSRKTERINTTIQIADTGITPGEGVGNKRRALNKETLGIPVVAIGVPTVVDAATIANDCIDLILHSLKNHAGEEKPLYKVLDTIEAEDKYSLIRGAIEPSLGNFIVAPKEVDTIIDDISKVIANGINISLHEGIDLADVDRYI